MNTYRIEMNDRQRARKIEAIDAREALAKAYGERFYSARHDSDSVRRDGSVEFSRYQVTVQTGPSRHGTTPVVERWATVYRA